MAFVDHRGWHWRVARLSEIEIPTSTGGNTQGPCPLDDVRRLTYGSRGGQPTTHEVAEYLKAHQREVRTCWHHRLSTADRRYVGELSCWFIEQELPLYEESIEAVIRRDGHSQEVVQAAQHLFSDPLRWNFVPRTQVGNGRHRCCALKLAGVARVAIQFINPS
jgi:hypothetical protein